MNINDAIRTRIQQLCNEKGWLINELIRRSNASTYCIRVYARENEVFIDHYNYKNIKRVRNDSFRVF